MSSVKRIVCLANSRKRGERCIAGIDLDTHRWIRPVCDSLYPENGRVPQSTRLVEGREPELLDILFIPLDKYGHNFGFEAENKSILNGTWRHGGKLKPQDLLQYCVDYKEGILHDQRKYVELQSLQRLPIKARRTLELVQTQFFQIIKEEKYGNLKFYANIRDIYDRGLQKVSITDPILLEKLNQNYHPKHDCLVTMSLSLPHRPPDWGIHTPDVCWKLIAGVIEL